MNFVKKAVVAASVMVAVEARSDKKVVPAQEEVPSSKLVKRSHEDRHEAQEEVPTSQLGKRSNENRHESKNLTNLDKQPVSKNLTNLDKQPVIDENLSDLNQPKLVRTKKHRKFDASKNLTNLDKQPVKVNEGVIFSTTKGAVTRECEVHNFKLVNGVDDVSVQVGNHTIHLDQTITGPISEEHVSASPILGDGEKLTNYVFVHNGGDAGKSNVLGYVDVNEESQYTLKFIQFDKGMRVTVQADEKPGIFHADIERKSGEEPRKLKNISFTNFQKFVNDNENDNEFVLDQAKLEDLLSPSQTSQMPETQQSSMFQI